MDKKNSDIDTVILRLSDFAKKSESGELSVSQFVSPAQAVQLKIELSRLGISDRAVFFGGYEDAERNVLFVLPSYTDGFDGDAKEKLFTFFPDEVKEEVCALDIEGGGFVTLSHRDYLGSLLSLGIERDVLGDVVLQNEHEAVIFCKKSIVEYISNYLERVSGDAVKVTKFEDLQNLKVHREFQRINATIASGRFDCVVSALTGLSREKSQGLIDGELCQIDYRVETRREYALCVPCTISIRGYGKFILREFSGTTKKGRIRISADKYI